MSDLKQPMLITQGPRRGQWVEKCDRRQPFPIHLVPSRERNQSIDERLAYLMVTQLYGMPASTEIGFEGWVCKTMDAFSATERGFVDESLATFTIGDFHFNTHTGKITRGSKERAARSGAEPWLIVAVPGARIETVGQVMARNEADAARICGFTLGTHLYYNRQVYRGKVAEDSGPISVQLVPLHSLPIFPIP